jgi:hypothetical protein
MEKKPETQIEGLPSEGSRFIRHARGLPKKGRDADAILSGCESPAVSSPGRVESGKDGPGGGGSSAGFRKELPRSADIFAGHVRECYSKRGMPPHGAETAQGEIRPGRAEKEIAETLYGQAMALHEMGKTELAIKQLNLVIECNGDHGEAHNDIGVLYHGEGDIAEALRHLNEALRIDPGNIEYKKNIAGVHLQAGRTKEAMQLYQDILKADPDNVQVLLIAADLCDASGLKDDALSLWRRVLEIEPDNEYAAQYFVS